MWRACPGGNPDKGGLGIDEFEFMVENRPYTTCGSKPKPPLMKPWRGC